MNLTRTYNYSIAAVLIVIYLALPATIFAQAVTLEGDSSSAKAAYSSTGAAPCNSCPCSGGQSSDCCDTVFCTCECQAPLGQGLQLTYAPMIASQNFPEPSWSFPQIYHPIFVPPQNLV
jgi:hypothetical protein